MCVYRIWYVQYVYMCIFQVAVNFPKGTFQAFHIGECCSFRATVEIDWKIFFCFTIILYEYVS